MPDDRKKLLGDLADVVLKTWAITQTLTRELNPDWKAIASVIDDQAAALKACAEEMRARA